LRLEVLDSLISTFTGRDLECEKNSEKRRIEKERAILPEMLQLQSGRGGTIPKKMGEDEYQHTPRGGTNKETNQSQKKRKFGLLIHGSIHENFSRNSK
jgi:hypothetical protein